ncbi:Hydroxyacylglutathione hydrolase [Seminavis robusta]|uniref:Hydroxyacylglutathione hydrolase n=1 Tax=Seminavis robusta TaxID=568900 RepID=A0A9N8DN22_9STRA|nr:Hydroxyacylglutathione hydrolase [Seminavis robusta]|eukprot:Sro227_g092430.1 Hydroxyacylglutathione hydrolase (549) ;mRNA; f:77884-79783
MFSGGGGVPFEAGSDAEVDQGAYKDNAQEPSGWRWSHAVERCFAEIIVRGALCDNAYEDSRTIQDQFLIFPGHEYTTELLSRQFGVPPSGNLLDANKWKNFPPAYFFETVSELYVALHRRSLPQATGKVLAAAPTTLRKELAVNPHLRSLARRAELVVQAIKLWDAFFCKPKTPKGEEAAVMRVRNDKAKRKGKNLSSSLANIPKRKTAKTPGTEYSWNMDTRDASRTVFTTIYTSDLDSVISDLARGKLNPEEAAGLIGFALLGSRPSGMTLSDSEAMKLPPPAIRDTSCIQVSKKRLLAMLSHLGFLDSVDGQFLVGMIHALWREANEYTNGTSDATTVAGSHDSKYNAVGKAEEEGHDTTTDDEEDASDGSDLISLGTLKWILYGFPARQPSWFSSFCMPCGFGMTSSENALAQRQGTDAQAEHAVQVSSMKRRHGELVRHDVMTCMLCRSATGCPESHEQTEEGEDEGDQDKDEDSLRLEFSSHYIPHLNRAEAPSDYNGPRDDESFVTSSNDSAVEVSTITSLLAGDMYDFVDEDGTESAASR